MSRLRSPRDRESAWITHRYLEYRNVEIHPTLLSPHGRRLVERLATDLLQALRRSWKPSPTAKTYPAGIDSYCPHTSGECSARTLSLSRSSSQRWRSRPLVVSGRSNSGRLQTRT
jgi:hypothetical protein